MKSIINLSSAALAKTKLFVKSNICIGCVGMVRDTDGYGVLKIISSSLVA